MKATCSSRTYKGNNAHAIMDEVFGQLVGIGWMLGVTVVLVLFVVSYRCVRIAEKAIKDQSDQAKRHHVEWMAARQVAQDEAELEHDEWMAARQVAQDEAEADHQIARDQANRHHIEWMAARQVARDQANRHHTEWMAARQVARDESEADRQVARDQAEADRQVSRDQANRQHVEWMTARQVARDEANADHQIARDQANRHHDEWMDAELIKQKQRADAKLERLRIVDKENSQRRDRERDLHRMFMMTGQALLAKLNASGNCNVVLVQGADRIEQLAAVANAYSRDNNLSVDEFKRYADGLFSAEGFEITRT
jgi:hypothetical protein